MGTERGGKVLPSINIIKHESVGMQVYFENVRSISAGGFNKFLHTALDRRPVTDNCTYHGDGISTRGEN